MGQVPIYFLFHERKTLSRMGVKSVHICEFTLDNKRATLTLTLTASGKTLTRMITCKGPQGACIEKHEFPNFPPNLLYDCQRN